MTQDNGIQRAALRKIIEEEFDRVSQAAQQQYQGPVQVSMVKCKIVDLMADAGVLDGTLTRRRE